MPVVSKSINFVWVTSLMWWVVPSCSTFFYCCQTHSELLYGQLENMKYVDILYNVMFVSLFAFQNVFLCACTYTLYSKNDIHRTRSLLWYTVCMVCLWWKCVLVVKSWWKCIIDPGKPTLSNLAIVDIPHADIGDQTRDAAVEREYSTSWLAVSFEICKNNSRYINVYLLLLFQISAKSRVVQPWKDRGFPYKWPELCQVLPWWQYSWLLLFKLHSPDLQSTPFLNIPGNILVFNPKSGYSLT